MTTYPNFRPRPMADIADYPGLLAEINAALVRYGAVGAFTISAAHEHFPLDREAGEVLLEVCNESTRTLTTRPVTQAELDALPADQVGVSEWAIIEGKPHRVRHCYSTLWPHAPREETA